MAFHETWWTILIMTPVGCISHYHPLPTTYLSDIPRKSREISRRHRDPSHRDPPDLLPWAPLWFCRLQWLSTLAWPKCTAARYWGFYRDLLMIIHDSLIGSLVLPQWARWIWRSFLIRKKRYPGLWSERMDNYGRISMWVTTVYCWQDVIVMCYFFAMLFLVVLF